MFKFEESKEGREGFKKREDLKKMEGFKNGS